MIELSLSNIKKYYGANQVLSDITFEVQTGERAGIVGENGCGKSTLLKIIMGIEGYEGGTLAIRKGATLGYLEQVPVYDDDFRVIDVLHTAFERVHEIQEEMRTLEGELSQPGQEDVDRLLNRYSNLQVLYESLGGYEIEEKLSRVCTGLNMGQDFLERLFSNLSGGEKTTVILGRILLQNPDILLLDEPSNHLDLDAMEWLEGYLKEYRGTVVIVSHDRYFLDNVAQKIVEIEDKVAKTYMGNYTEYVQEKDRHLKLQFEAFLTQQKKIKSMEKAITQLRDWGSRGDNNKFFRRASSMQIMLDKMDKIDKPTLERESIRINANMAERSGNDVVIIEGLCKSFGCKTLLKDSDLLIRNGECVSLIGANGCGKSTLIKILLGLIEPDSGKSHLGSSIKLAYLPQNISFTNENQTVLDCFREDIVITEGKAREYLAKYMFFSEAVFKRVGSLSGGERSRLMLSKLMYNEVNLLILDEPTNHLDIDSREELEEYLRQFSGTLLFVSHDRYFINSTATRVVELSDGKLISYEGNYEYYKEKISARRTEDSTLKKPESKPAPRNKITKLQEVKDSGEKIQKDIEGRIEELEKQLKAVDEEIEKFGDDYERLNILYNERVSLHSQVDKLMEQYYNL